MVGWTILLDYFFLPMVVWLIGTAYLTDQFPGVPKWIFLVSFIVLTTVLNVLGIRLATRVNIVLLSFQLLVLVFFLLFSLRYVLGGAGAGTFFSVEPFWNSGSTVPAVSAGAALTAYSVIGFDAVSTFAEEAVEPRRTIPRAIVLTAALAGTIFVIVAFVVQLVHPGGHSPTRRARRWTSPGRSRVTSSPLSSLSRVLAEVLDDEVGPERVEAAGREPTGRPHSSVPTSARHDGTRVGSFCDPAAVDVRDDRGCSPGSRRDRAPPTSTPCEPRHPAIDI
jgi:amino acid transporter